MSYFKQQFLDILDVNIKYHNKYRNERFQQNSRENKSLHSGTGTGHNTAVPSYISSSAATWLTLNHCKLCNCWNWVTWCICCTHSLLPQRYVPLLACTPEGAGNIIGFYVLEVTAILTISRWFWASCWRFILCNSILCVCSFSPTWVLMLFFTALYRLAIGLRCSLSFTFPAFPGCGTLVSIPLTWCWSTASINAIYFLAIQRSVILRAIWNIFIISGLHRVVTGRCQRGADKAVLLGMVLRYNSNKFQALTCCILNLQVKEDYILTFKLS